MKKIVKRILSLGLCVCMVITTTVTSYASQNDSTTSMTSDDIYANAVNELVAQVAAVKATTPAPASLTADSEARAQAETRIATAESLVSVLLAEVPENVLKGSFLKSLFRNENEVASRFSGGTGSETDPYILSSKEDFLSISANVADGISAYYQMDRDIDLSGLNWTPIGDASTSFTGHFDGNSHVLRNLSIDSATSQVGLFGVATNATFKNIQLVEANVSGGSITGALIGQGASCTLSNITLERCTIRGTSHVGGVAGVLSASNVDNCAVDGYVTNTGDYTGGLVSFMIAGTIKNSLFSGVVTGATYSGGFTGTLSGDMETCTNIGSVSGSNTVGGITGQFTSINSYQTVKNCYNTGSVTGASEVGGITGFILTSLNMSDQANLVSNGNVGTIHASGSYAGGIVGDMSGSTYVVVAYNRGHISAGGSSCGGVVGRFNSIPDFNGALSAAYNAGKVRTGSIAGSVIGYSNAVIVLNSYYLNEQPTGFQVPAIAINRTQGPCSVVAKSSAELKTMAPTLNATMFGDDINVINDGFPILTGVNYAIGKGNHDFKFRGNFNTTSDSTAQYYYYDNYFSKPATDYNQHLATMSLSLALSAFASYETGYETQYINAKNLLQNIGFSNIDVNDDYTAKPTTDSIGVITGMKELTIDGTETTVIAAAIRGSGYESEWAGNLTLGESGFHQGFATARDKVLEHLTSYIAAQQISGNVKIWITGFSRAAATANLVAGALNNGAILPSCDYTASDVYAYTFETPRGVLQADTQAENYDNIFNIIWGNDPVPKVAPAIWDFAWYSNPLRIPTAATAGDTYEAAFAKMVNRLKALGIKEAAYLVDDFQEIKVDIEKNPDPLSTTFPIWFTPIISTNDNQDTFLDTAISALARDALQSRSNYVSKYQQGIQEMVSVAFVDEAGKEEFYTLFMSKINQNLGVLLLTTGAFIASEQVIDRPDLATYYLTNTMDRIKSYVVESANECGMISLTETEVDEFAQNVFGLFGDFVVPHVDICANMILNSDSIMQAHFPEICLAWMQSMDSYYTPDSAPSFVSGDYRIVRISGEADVTVYGAENVSLSTITSDGPASNSALASKISAEGEKLVYLPMDKSYQLVIEATDTSTLSYTVNEYSQMAGDITRVIGFSDIVLEEGVALVADIPVGRDISQRNTYLDTPDGYSLVDSSGQPISVSVDLEGEDAMQAYYLMEVSSNNEQFGLVSGNGVKQIGNFAQVSAYPITGYKFVGWYDNDRLISNEAVYRFKVTADTILTAHFESANDTQTNGKSPLTPASEAENSRANSAADSGTSSGIPSEETASEPSDESAEQNKPDTGTEVNGDPISIN